jgi:DNA-binding NarL/FixJ family response regulator
MGINLPDAPGIVSLGKLKSSLPKTHILMYADSMDADDIWGALAIGATGYFLMGTPIDELLTAIQKLQSGKFITRSEVARKTVNLFRCPVFGQDATRLSERQTKVLDLLVRGYSNRQIAVELKVGVSTVITHVARIFKKLDVHSRAQAVAKFTRNLNLEVADYSREGLSKPE